ncbi:CHAP domain-containing protein [Actinoallomurus rhizosphaericola]|uniref:CHAP domain-containing protein n=1 Tax=Actinoallomurus rhizosphaericola TaxID=2952536 RepID=UPI002092FAFD|nr:CHAP domain-containing protein [Actinoallomurus rhizosphaericola]MCO5995908.1 CHAP domain-containing protein [Actinoallomurus rhizosphaericola]
MSAVPRPQRSGARLAAVLSGLTAAGAAAVLVTAAGPAEASSLPARAAAQAHQVKQVSIPGRGMNAKPKPKGDPKPKADPKAKVMAERRLPVTATDALKIALAQVGTSEDGDGSTKYSRWFAASPWAQRGVQRDGGSVGDYADANWCDMFVTWVGAQAGVQGIGGDAFAPAHAAWFQAQGRWGTTPKPGAVVFFSWSGGKDIDSIDHVGLVIKDNGDGTIQTVEGNTDDAVKVRTRDTSEVVGYGYPEYGQ